VHGDLLAQATDLRGAESCFLQSPTIAGYQHALSWRLQTSTSFARLLVRQDRLPVARAILDEVYAHFTEGFETADLRRAKALLGELGGHVTD
jgi:predicted ATPase